MIDRSPMLSFEGGKHLRRSLSSRRSRYSYFSPLLYRDRPVSQQMRHEFRPASPTGRSTGSVVDLAAVVWLAIVRERDVAERGDAMQAGGGANRVGDGAGQR